MQNQSLQIMWYVPRSLLPKLLLRTQQNSIHKQLLQKLTLLRQGSLFSYWWCMTPFPASSPSVVSSSGSLSSICCFGLATVLPRFGAGLCILPLFRGVWFNTIRLPSFKPAVPLALEKHILSMKCTPHLKVGADLEKWFFFLLSFKFLIYTYLKCILLASWNNKIGSVSTRDWEFKLMFALLFSSSHWWQDTTLERYFSDP